MMRMPTLPGLLLLAASASADTYWISYNPSTGRYPEEEGWTRNIGGGGALRYFDNGALVIDSRASISIVDYYDMLMHGHLDPSQPGEQFVMRWRVRIDEVQGVDDDDAGVVSDHNWKVFFGLGYDRIYSEFEPGVSAPFAPGVFHTFELRSSDMRGYTLDIDGQRAINGSFWHSGEASRVGWGDGVEGYASMSHWESFDFGVVPEANSVLLGLMPVSLWRVRHST